MAPHQSDIHLPPTAETMLLDVYRVVQHHALPGVEASRADLLNELLEILDGPEAMQVYNRLKLRPRNHLEP
jgi:hypothetical protein